MSHARFVPPLLLGTVLLGACGAQEAPAAAPTDAGSATPSVTATPAPTPTPTPTSTPPTRTPRPSPSPTPSATEGGNGDAEGDDTPATAGGGICGRLSAGEVGAVANATVIGAAMPGGGCEFTQSDRRAAAVSFVDRPWPGNNGMDTAKNEATSSVEGIPEDVSGIGTVAFVVTGTSFGGEDVQGAGAVHVGSRLVSVGVTQQRGLSAARVRDLVLAALRLVVREQDG